MSIAVSGSEQADLRFLDKRWLVILVYLISLGLLLRGALLINYHYGAAPYVVRFWTTELQVAILLFIATLFFFPAARIGWRRSQWVNGGQVLPMLILIGTAMAVWGIARIVHPSYIAIDNHLSFLILRTTVLVGLSEEWMYRGLLLTALVRWLGVRRGALLSLFLFGLLHLLNIAAGASVIHSIAQFFMTILIGATLVLATFGTRSLILPIFGHGIYDFCVIDTSQLLHADSGPWAMITIFSVGLVCGLYCLYRILRLEQGEPFVE
jgi:membrane protease YdiL (CAAX protease family)